MSKSTKKSANKTYEVQLTARYNYTTTITAASEKEAWEKAQSLLENVNIGADGEWYDGDIQYVQEA